MGTTVIKTVGQLRGYDLEGDLSLFALLLHSSHLITPPFILSLQQVTFLCTGQWKNILSPPHTICFR